MSPTVQQMSLSNQPFFFKSEADFKLPQRRCDAELDKVNNITNSTAIDLIAS